MDNSQTSTCGYCKERVSAPCGSKSQADSCQAMDVVVQEEVEEVEVQYA